MIRGSGLNRLREVNLDFVAGKTRMKKIPVHKGIPERTAGFCGKLFVGFLGVL